jgi:hypothetical protein
LRLFFEEITPRLVYQTALTQYYPLWLTNQALTPRDPG